MPPKAAPHPAHPAHPAPRPVAHHPPKPAAKARPKPKPKPPPPGSPTSDFEAVYHAVGIAGFVPKKNIADHIFAFDGSSTGCKDHLFCFRSGHGVCSVLRNVQGTWTPIYQATKGGIGGWDFMEYLDRAIAYDYDHSGKMDHVLFFRPAHGMVWISKHDGNGNFTPVYQSNGGGIGGYDMRYPWDRIICFDFDKSMKCDTLLCYRRATSGYCIVKNFNGIFVPVYKEYCWGIGGFMTGGEGFYAFAFDWDHNGTLDHILFIDNSFSKAYSVSGVVTRQGDRMVTVWKSPHPLGGFPVTPNKLTIGFPYDFESLGTDNYFGMIWLNKGACWIMVSPESNGAFTKVYQREAGGIGDCNLNANSHAGVVDTFAMQDRCFAFDHDSSGCNDYLFIYRRPTGQVWILRRKGHQPTPRNRLEYVDAYTVDWQSQGSSPLYAPPSDPGFTPVYSTDQGVAGFQLATATDQCIPYDYDHSGKTDHLCLFSPGHGSCVIMRNAGNNQFTAVYSQNGIGAYDLMSAADQAFAFDFDHSGRMDHLCLYRPGTGIFWIMANYQGQFTPVFYDGDPRNKTNGVGIGGFAGHTVHDRAFAFDYASSGLKDHICLYRPGTGIFWILQNNQGQFTPVFESKMGIGGYDLKGATDSAIAFDYDHSGKLDHIFISRPGQRVASIIRNVNGQFQRVYFQGHPSKKDPWPDFRVTIGAYDFADAGDQAFAYDYQSSGKQDHLVFYRPGQGIVFVVQHLMGGFSSAYQGFGMGLKTMGNQHVVHTTDFSLYQSQGKGLGGFDFSQKTDRCLAFDFMSSGRNDHIVIYRPGHKTLWVVHRTEAAYPVVPPAATASW